MEFAQSSLGFEGSVLNAQKFRGLMDERRKIQAFTAALATLRYIE